MHTHTGTQSLLLVHAFVRLLVHTPAYIHQLYMYAHTIHTEVRYGLLVLWCKVCGILRYMYDPTRGK